MIDAGGMPPPRGIRLVGAILAGGQSRRMGVAKAGVALPDGRVLAEVAWDALSTLCDEVVVLGHAAGVPPAWGLTRIEDRPPGVGPLGGVAGLLASGRGDAYVIVPCDLPFVLPAHLKPLAEALRGGATAVVVGNPARPQGFEPLPLGLAAGAAAPLTAFLEAGGGSIWRFAQGLAPLQLASTAELLQALRGVNTPQALADRLV